MILKIFFDKITFHQIRAFLQENRDKILAKYSGLK